MQSLAIKLNIAARWLTMLGVTMPLVGIALASIFLACAILVFVAEWFITRRRIWFPPIATPLLLFMLSTAMSLAFSPEPFLGRAAISKFWLFAIILLVVNVLTEQLVTQCYLMLFGLSMMAALLVIGQFLIIGQVSVETRLTGFMGHWMTLSGELMLVCVAMAGFLLFAKPKRLIFWFMGLSAVGLALSLTLTRSVWLATLAGLLILLLMKHWHWRTLVVAALTVAILLLAAPAVIKRRVQSVVDLNDPSNYARIAIWRAGLRMVQAHPWVGVGPQRVSKVFYDYHPYPEDRHRSGFFPVHMHNNLLQFAAERGVPCALFWLWLMIRLARNHWEGFKRSKGNSQRTSLYAIGFASVVVLFLAGLFEFNFGDSEVLMVFLFLVSAPYTLESRLSSLATV